MVSLWLLNRNFRLTLCCGGYYFDDLAKVILAFELFYCFEFSVCSHFVSGVEAES